MTILVDGQPSLHQSVSLIRKMANAQWHTFNSHNFAEVFRYRTYEELQNPASNEICKKIGGPCYGYTHDLA